MLAIVHVQVSSHVEGHVVAAVTVAGLVGLVGQVAASAASGVVLKVFEDELLIVVQFPHDGGLDEDGSGHDRVAADTDAPRGRARGFLGVG